MISSHASQVYLSPFLDRLWDMYRRSERNSNRRPTSWLSDSEKPIGKGIRAFGRRWMTPNNPQKRRQNLLVNQVLHVLSFDHTQNSMTLASAQVFQRRLSTLNPIHHSNRATPKENNCRSECLKSLPKSVRENHSNASCADASFQMLETVWTGSRS